MSEEEKEAVEHLKNYPINWEITYEVNQMAINIILNLLEKQQEEIKKLEEQKRGVLVETYKNNDEKDKEIEELKEKNKTLETLLQGNLYEMFLYYKELASRYQANSISKDKIREKIEELEETIKKKRQLNIKEWVGFEENEIEILEELLEENNNE